MNVTGAHTRNPIGVETTNVHAMNQTPQAKGPLGVELEVLTNQTQSIQTANPADIAIVVQNTRGATNITARLKVSMHIIYISAPTQCGG
jgi:hypothetical protein